MVVRPRSLVAVGAIMLLALTGCGPAKPVTMPDVVGDRLDIAKSDIERAGYGGDIEILGGGLFGVLDDRNWVVCEQEPAAGKTVQNPRLVVERECGGDEEPTEEPEDPDDAVEAGPVTDTTVDVLLDALNAGTEGEPGDRFRFTGELFHSELWMTGATGDYVVLFSAHGGADDLFVLMDEADAAGWTDGMRIEVVVENVEVTLDGETTDGWLRVITAEPVG